MLGLVAFGLAASNTAVADRPAVTAGAECHFEEWPTYMCNENEEWVPMPVGGLGNRARCWTFETNYMDSCNKVCWPVTLKNEAAVAQWMIISMDYDGFHWGVRKPGDYVAGCADVTVRSNCAIEVSLSGFEDLLAVDCRCTIDSVIEVKYAFDDQGQVPPPCDDSIWMTPCQLNQMTWQIDDSYQLHWDGWTQHIWSTIHVSPCNGPTEFVDRDWATITYCLDNQQPWICPETGLFNGMPEFPFQ